MTQLFDTLGFIDASAARAGAASTTHDVAAAQAGGVAVSLEQAIEEQREYPAVKAMVASQDYIEGPKAFSEKRPPKWVGK